ncbi:hypothetical protein ACFWIW_24470 [Amycolatopsis sp. NPDC058340]|uniref:hypothetical protein n=1 Tax=Amycolatopsis sp. NPDC058340 TaxID=3346453 RepID=UPI00365A8F4F
MGRNDNDGWTVETSPDGSLSRWRVDPSKVAWFESCQGDFFSDQQLAALAEDARVRKMTRLEYLSWVCRLPTSELHKYRDRVIAGDGGPNLPVLYDAWLTAQSVVRDVQILFRGLPGQPDKWA